MSEDSPKSFELPSLDELSALLPHLEIQQFVAHGGMGGVYHAIEQSLGRPVALKVSPQALGEEDIRSRFELEVKAMAQLEHPNLARLYDYGIAGEVMWMSQEWVDGPTLQLRLLEGPLSEAEAIAIVRQVCDALADAHQHGIVHRDVKPENIMWNRQGVVKLMDFGLARATQHGPAFLRAGNEARFLTKEYASPEMFDAGAEIDHRADIFSLGVLAYEALTGLRPSGEFRLPSEVKPELGVRFDHVLSKAMMSDRDGRPASCAEFKQAFEVAASMPVVVEIQELEFLSLAPEGSKARSLVALAGAVVLVVGIAWFAISSLRRSGKAEQPPAASPPPVELAVDEPAPVEPPPDEPGVLPGAPLPPGLVLYYSFEGSDGKTVLDLSGSGHSGVIHGAVPVSGIRGMGLQFDGVDDFVEVSAEDLKLASQDFTIGLWVRPEKNKTHGLVERHVAREPGLFFHLILKERMIKGDFWEIGSVQHELPANFVHRWTLLMFTFEARSRRLGLYVDGQPTGHEVLTDEAFFDDAPLVLGRFDKDDPENYFAGILDEVMIFDRALRFREIIALHKRGKRRDP